MKILLRLSRDAIRYKTLYVIAILSTLCLTGVNLAAPRALSAMTGVVERGVDEAGMRRQFEAAIMNKPPWHGELSYAAPSQAGRTMDRIGG